MSPKEKTMTYDEFVDIDNNTDEYLEFIDGVVYNQASPSTLHQRISVNLTAEFRNFFGKKL